MFCYQAWHHNSNGLMCGRYDERLLVRDGGRAAITDTPDTATAQVALSEPVILMSQGNMFQSALAIADVDNDEHGDAELVVGTTEGSVLVFKVQKALTMVPGVLCFSRLAGDCSGLGPNNTMASVPRSWNDKLRSNWRCP